MPTLCIKSQHEIKWKVYLEKKGYFSFAVSVVLNINTDFPSISNTAGEEGAAEIFLQDAKKSRNEFIIYGMASISHNDCSDLMTP